MFFKITELFGSSFFKKHFLTIKTTWYISMFRRLVRPHFSETVQALTKFWIISNFQKWHEFCLINYNFFGTNQIIEEVFSFRIACIKQSVFSIFLKSTSFFRSFFKNPIPAVETSCNIIINDQSLKKRVRFNWRKEVYSWVFVPETKKKQILLKKAAKKFLCQSNCQPIRRNT